MNLHELKIYAVKMAKDYPTLKEDIYEMVDLAIAEVEEGGFESSECDLAKHEIDSIVNELLIETEIQKRDIPGGEETVRGYSNYETYLMVSHIHNNQEWLEESFELIRQTDNSHRLMIHFHDEIFKGRELKDIFGKLAFGNVNWNEIFVNLKEMMPKIRFEVGDYLMIVDGADLTFDWKGKVFVFDSYDGNEEGAIDITDHSGEDVQHYELFEHRFVKVNQEWRFVPESDRWISEWRDEHDNDVVAVNYFQGHDSFNDLQEDFFLPDPKLTEKVLVLAKKTYIDDAIWSVIHEENTSKEDLLERLALANIQAKRLFDLLYDLQTNCKGYGSLEEEMSRIHNIKLLTNVSTDEWKYQD